MKQNRFRTMWVAVGMVLLSLPVGAQGLSLEECQRLAWTNYPLLKKYNLIEQTTSYSIKNINRGYLPQLSFNGQASYQSDAANLPDVLSDMLESNGYDYKGLGKDQYKLALDLNQAIWDGGNMEAQKKVTKLEGKVQTAQTDVDMYAIRERVNELFFGILFIEDKIKLNQELQTLLQDNCRKLENRLAHGTAMKADVNVMRAEYLKAKQDMTALASMKTSYQQMLAIFTGKEASDITNLQKPEASMPASHENQRPELNLFAAQMAKTDAQKKQLNAGICPKLSLFAQGYYGYPGFDMFGDMFDHNLSLNGIVGVKFSWNIGRLYTHKNDKRKLDLAHRQIETAQEAFLFNSSLESTQEMQAIRQYRQMMEEDKDIITLRTSIRQAAESKLEHGVINVNDLLQEITRENQARIDHSTHEVEMLKNIYELKNTINQ